MSHQPRIAEKTLRFRDFALIGGGAEGLVWRATALTGPTPVAIKEFPRNARGFYQELRAREGLTHENLLALVDFYDDLECPCIVWEYCSGGSLRDRLEGPEPLSLRQLLELGAHVAAALDAVHAQRLVHGDVKPENILLKRRTGPRLWKLADFGIASVEDPSRRVRHATPQYAAPELRIGNRTAKSDVHSLGIVLRECLDAVPLEARTDDRAIRSELLLLIGRMTSTDPDGRPPAAQCRAELLQLDARLAAIRHVSTDGVAPINFPMEGDLSYA
jgi:serine/threonine-protein kinase